jgi:hypothetical protein
VTLLKRQRSTRLRHRRPRTVLKEGLPIATVCGLHQYDNGRIDVNLYYDSTLIPAKRAKEFQLGQKFKLVPIP